MNTYELIDQMFFWKITAMITICLIAFLIGLLIVVYKLRFSQGRLSGAREILVKASSHLDPGTFPTLINVYSTISHDLFIDPDDYENDIREAEIDMQTRQTIFEAGRKTVGSIFPGTYPQKA